jgi:DNA repair exonuclease SbcCD ATPase subunit
LQYLENTLQRQKEKEIKDIQTILDELEAGIHREIHANTESGQPYLPGFSPEEIAQKRKDFYVLTERIKRIPQEREEEAAIIEKHYAKPVDRTFPIAVVFLVPQSQVGRIP